MIVGKRLQAGREAAMQMAIGTEELTSEDEDEEEEIRERRGDNSAALGTESV